MSEGVPSDVAQKIVIKFLANENVGSTEIFNRLNAQFGANCLPQKTVTEYCQNFKHIILIKKEPKNEIKTEVVCGCTTEHGYAALELISNPENLSSPKIIYAKKFRAIRPAPANNIKQVALNKKIIPTKKIFLPRRLEFESKAKSVHNISKPPMAVNVLIAQAMQLEANKMEEKLDVLENTNQPKVFKKIAPKISPIAIVTPVTNVVPLMQNEDNCENEIPQGVDNEVVIESQRIESDILEENNYLTNLIPLAEHRYAIAFDEQEQDKSNKNRQGKPLSPEQKIIAYDAYVNDRISKNCSKSKSIAHAAISVGISCGTMWNLVKEMEQNGQFAPPKKRKKRSNCYEILDDTNKNKLQKIVKQLITNGDLPTVDKIYMTLKDDSSFPQMSRTTVYNQLKKLGFKYEKRGREKILKEKKNGAKYISTR